MNTVIRYDAQGTALWSAFSPSPSVTLSPGSDPDLVYAISSPSLDNTTLALGAFDAAAGFTPIYQKQMQVDAPQHMSWFNEDGTAQVVLNRGPSIDVVNLDANGNLDWARSYTSDLFLETLGSGQFFDSSQTAFLYDLSHAGLSGSLLVVSISESEITGIQTPGLTTTHTLVLARLNANGSVQWARQYDGFSASLFFHPVGPCRIQR